MQISNDKVKQKMMTWISHYTTGFISFHWLLNNCKNSPITALIKR